MSARSCCVTCGIVAQAAVRCSAVLRRTARIGCRSISPQRVKSGSGSRGAPRRPPPAPSTSRLACALTSSIEIRPPGPLPGTSLMSTPSSRAMRRTDGAAGAGGSFAARGRLGRRPRAAVDVDDLARRGLRRGRRVAPVDRHAVVLRPPLRATLASASSACCLLGRARRLSAAAAGRLRPRRRAASTPPLGGSFAPVGSAGFGRLALAACSLGRLRLGFRLRRPGFRRRRRRRLRARRPRR